MITHKDVTATSERGRVLDFRIVVGAQEEDYTELHLLGTVEFRGQHYGVRGTHPLREGRDSPDVYLYRCDSGEAIQDAVADDILYALFSVLDAQEDGLIAQELRRICE